MEDFLISINDMMQDHALLAFAACYVWGIISTLLSPCHLASIPLLVSYIAGQPMTVTPRHAGEYSALFSFGLFTAILTVGAICAFLGVMLGEVPVGIYAAAGLMLIVMGVKRIRRGCAISYWRIYERTLNGYQGAFLLGLIYGIISGTCIFGFLAPMLLVILEERQVLKGVLMTVIFGMGHCTPIIIAGCGYGLAKDRYLSNEWLLRPISAAVIILIGVYFLSKAMLVWVKTI